MRYAERKIRLEVSGVVWRQRLIGEDKDFEGQSYSEG